uniref:Uncharacterized protein n=1 Tax=Desertifilum tharense IPPAS B-1220 TaxID=1781255 RepID=A0ACD5H0V6_9CYAN
MGGWGEEGSWELGVRGWGKKGSFLITPYSTQLPTQHSVTHSALSTLHSALLPMTHLLLIS